ncbi:MAG TPA: hypothetical protein VG318_01360 [Actinomycetota bacterium]|nr:hypothetical protein [Actinomycetota bacterium]
MTSTKTRRALATAAVVTSGLIPVAQVTPAYGDPPIPCTVVGEGERDGPRVVLALHAVEPGAAVIVARCDIVQSEVTVASASAIGVVAVDAVRAKVAPGDYAVCADIWVLYVDGSESADRSCR